MTALPLNPRIYPTGAQVAQLADGRLHFHHGPIDIILQAWGDPEVLALATAKASNRFATVLPELCAELSELRSEFGVVSGPLARAMAAAVMPFRPSFITPMAAVAGAVADWVLQDFCVDGIEKAYANNGGDIAIHLAPGQMLNCAIAAQNACPGRISLRSASPVRGIATSGWRGRSWSLGIADAVTVVARTSAMADAAATMIANAVDLPDHPAIFRQPANSLQNDSDLGARLVTVEVPILSARERGQALNRGLAAALDYQSRGLIEGALLFLQGESLSTTGLAITQ